MMRALAVTLLALVGTADAGGRKLVVQYTPAHDGGGTPKPEAERFGRAARFLDARLRLPRRVVIKFASCGHTNAFYVPRTHSIWMCHELHDYFEHLFVRAGMAGRARELARYAMTFAFFHELGHALVEELTLPITGSGEDAADELATIMLSRLGEGGNKAATTAVLWFARAAKERAAVGREHGIRDFLDAHSLDEQRMASVACLLYGADRVTYAPLVKLLRFGAARLIECRRDYEARRRAWGRLLRPQLR